MKSVEFAGQNQVHVGNGTGLSIKHIGQSEFLSPFSSKPLILNQLLHVLSITKNLLLVSKFSKDNKVFFEFHFDSYFVKDQGIQVVLMVRKVRDGLYAFDSSHLALRPTQSLLKSPFVVASSFSFKVCTTSLSSTFDLWHIILGHPSATTIKNVLSKCNVTHINKMDSNFRSSCCLGKIHRFSFSLSRTAYTKPLELIHLDLWGPAPVLSNSGYRYYIHFVDAFSRFSWIFLLRNKYEAIKTFVNFKTQLELQFDSKIKFLQIDYGGEFHAFQSYLAKNGIVHRVSCPHTQQQNGVAKQKHRTIVEHGLTLLHTTSLPLKFWDESFRTVVYLLNRLPIAVFHHKCPIEVLFKSIHNYSFLKVFGYSCFPNLRPYNTHKVQYRSEKCTFLSYSINHKGYKCMSSNG